MAIGRPGADSDKNGKKKTGPIKTFSVNAETKKYLEKKAEHSTYFASLLEQANESGTLTEKQMLMIEKEVKRDEEYANRPKMKDESGVAGPVNNRVFRDNKIVCFIGKCKDFAKVRVGNIGVCNDHVEDAKDLNEEYEAKKAARA